MSVCLCVFEIDMLVNNAGRSQMAWAIDTPLQIDREIIDLNVIGPVSLTKCVLPHMMARRHGYIIVTSSVTGKLRKSTSFTLHNNNVCDRRRLLEMTAEGGGEIPIPFLPPLLPFSLPMQRYKHSVDSAFPIHNRVYCCSA